MEKYKLFYNRFRNVNHEANSRAFELRRDLEGPLIPEHILPLYEEAFSDIFNQYHSTLHNNNYLLGKVYPISKISFYLRSYLYSKIVNHFHRRYIIPSNYRKDEDIPIFFLYYTSLFLKKVEESNQLEYKWFYIQMSRKMTFLFSYSVVQLLRYQEVDGRTIFYIQDLLSDKFCEFISILRAYRLREKISHSTIELNKELLDNLNELRFCNVISTEYLSLDDILPEDYLIHWKDDSKNDFIFTQIKPIYSHESLEIYRKAVNALIDDIGPIKIEPITDLDLFSNLSESKIFLTDTRELKTGSVRVAYRKNIESIRKREYLKDCASKYKRRLIYVSPDNVRDAWIPDLNTRLRNTYYDLLFKQIIENHPRCLMCSRKDYNRRIFPIYKLIDNYKIMIDLKKEGLTTPHELIKILCEEFTKAYKIDFNYIYMCIKNQQIYDDSFVSKTYRGRGLGMLNYMFTTLNIAVSYMIPYRSVIFIDDSVFALDNEIYSFSRIREILSLIINIYQSLGFIISHKKSIISKSFVILENYYQTRQYDFDDRKLFRDFASLFDIIYSNSYFEMKSKCNNYIANNFIIEPIWTAYRNCIQRFNSEFIPDERTSQDELNLPSSLGGWGFNFDRYIDRSLETICKIKDSRILKIVRKLLLNKKRLNINKVFREYNPVKIDRSKFQDSLNEFIGIKDSILYNLYKMYSFESRIDKIEESLNFRSLSKLKKRDIERIQYIRKSRESILTNSLKDESLHIYDLIKLIINFYKEEFNTCNFSIPEELVSESFEYPKLLMLEGGISYPQFYGFTRSEIIHSYLYKMGVLKKKPNLTIIDTDLPILDNVIRAIEYSYKGCIIEGVDEFIDKFFDYSLNFAFLNMTSEFAIIDYYCRTGNIPISFKYITTDKSLKESLENNKLFEKYLFEFNIQGKKVYISERFWNFWKDVRHHIPPLDRAYIISICENFKLLRNINNYQGRSLIEIIKDCYIRTRWSNLEDFHQSINFEDNFQYEKDFPNNNDELSDELSSIEQQLIHEDELSEDNKSYKEITYEDIMIKINQNKVKKIEENDSIEIIYESKIDTNEEFIEEGDPELKDLIHCISNEYKEDKSEELNFDNLDLGEGVTDEELINIDESIDNDKSLDKNLKIISSIDEIIVQERLPNNNESIIKEDCSSDKSEVKIEDDIEIESYKEESRVSDYTQKELEEIENILDTNELTERKNLFDEINNQDKDLDFLDIDESILDENRSENSDLKSFDDLDDLQIESYGDLELISFNERLKEKSLSDSSDSFKLNIN